MPFESAALDRIPIGLWTELTPGSRWTNEGVARVVGFLVEGAAQSRRYTFRLVVPHGMAELIRADLRSVDAREHVDWSVQEGPDYAGDFPGLSGLAHHRASMDALARFANANAEVEGWVITFPFFEASKLLEKRRAVLFPDAIPFDFPWGWPADWQEEGAWPSWFRKTKGVLAQADTVITFSKHVAQRQARGMFDVPVHKLHVIPLAPPNLSPALSAFAAPTQHESRGKAAEALRRHATERDWRYLSSFAFEDADYAVVSTQDRPTKNISFVARTVLDLTRRKHRPLKLLTTATLHFGATWTDLPGLVEGAQAPLDIVSMHDVPRDVHAALYACARVTIHASFFEGIVGALPFFESLSVGTPSIMARGPHTQELLDTFPEIRPFTFDPYSVSDLEALVLTVLDDRDGVVARQRPIYEKLRQRTWGQVADEYAAAALGLPPQEAFKEDARARFY